MYFEEALHGAIVIEGGAEPIGVRQVKWATPLPSYALGSNLLVQSRANQSLVAELSLMA
jgi:hypothetical protein